MAEYEPTDAELWMTISMHVWIRSTHDQRMGQFLFNTLNAVNPELANEIRSGELDPFYDDEKVGDFLVYVLDHWV